MKKLFFGLVSILAVAVPPLMSTTFAPTTLQKLTETSTVVVTARVESVESRWDAAHKKIHTFSTVKIKQVLKGEDIPLYIHLQEPGGRVGEDEWVIHGSAQFAEDEEVLLFLVYHRDRYWVHSMAMGKFNIETEDSEKVVVNRQIDKDLITTDRTMLNNRSKIYQKYDLQKFTNTIKLYKN